MFSSVASLMEKAWNFCVINNSYINRTILDPSKVRSSSFWFFFVFHLVLFFWSFLLLPVVSLSVGSMWRFYFKDPSVTSISSGLPPLYKKSKNRFSRGENSYTYLQSKTYTGKGLRAERPPAWQSSHSWLAIHVVELFLRIPVWCVIFVCIFFWLICQIGLIRDKYMRNCAWEFRMDGLKSFSQNREIETRQDFKNLKSWN